MNLRIRCASHNQVLKIFSSYKGNAETVIDVVPCPECASQQMRAIGQRGESAEIDENPRQDYKRYKNGVRQPRRR